MNYEPWHLKSCISHLLSYDVSVICQSIGGEIECMERCLFNFLSNEDRHLLHSLKGECCNAWFLATWLCGALWICLSCLVLLGTPQVLRARYDLFIPPLFGIKCINSCLLQTFTCSKRRYSGKEPMRKSRPALTSLQIRSMPWRYELWRKEHASSPQL